MTDITLRPPRPHELAGLSALQLRSKAHWGYDAAFMRACRDALTLTQADPDETDMIMAVSGTDPAGLAQVGTKGSDAASMGMFIDPAFPGAGLGRMLPLLEYPLR